MKNGLIPTGKIENKILLIRSHNVMLSNDLAELYGVEVRVLNQAVRRNIDRFPPDFVFQLNKAEKTEVITNCDRLKNLKYSSSLPYAFTEQGVAMLSSVLKSKNAVRVNIEIMRTFVKLRHLLSTNEKLAMKLNRLEKKYDRQFKSVFDAIRSLMNPPISKKRKIGFEKNNNQ